MHSSCETITLLKETAKKRDHIINFFIFWIDLHERNSDEVNKNKFKPMLTLQYTQYSWKFILILFLFQSQMLRDRKSFKVKWRHLLNSARTKINDRNDSDWSDDRTICKKRKAGKGLKDRFTKVIQTIKRRKKLQLIEWKEGSSSNMRCGRQYRGLKAIHRLSLSVVLWPIIEKEDVQKFQRPEMPLMRKQYYFGMIINYFEQDLSKTFL